MDEFLKNLGEFLSFLGDLFFAALSGLYILFTYLVTSMQALIKRFIPVLPSLSKFLGKNSISGTVLCLLFIYIVVMNMYSFHLFLADKKKSKKKENQKDGDATLRGRRTYDRISERRLIRVCFFGGAFGGFLGMKMAHHKTLKPKFSIGIPIMLFIQLLIFSFICGFFGFWLYLS